MASLAEFPNRAGFFSAREDDEELCGAPCGKPGSRIEPMRYAVVIEKGQRSYSAYVPDLPGCVSVGDTLEDVKADIREAIAFHLEGMREDGLPIPEPSS